MVSSLRGFFPISTKRVMENNLVPSRLLHQLSKLLFLYSIEGQMHSLLFILLFFASEDKYISKKIYIYIYMRIRFCSFLPPDRLTTHKILHSTRNRLDAGNKGRNGRQNGRILFSSIRILVAISRTSSKHQRERKQEAEEKLRARQRRRRRTRWMKKILVQSINGSIQHVWF